MNNSRNHPGRNAQVVASVLAAGRLMRQATMEGEMEGVNANTAAYEVWDNGYDAWAGRGVHSSIEDARAQVAEMIGEVEAVGSFSESLTSVYVDPGSTDCYWVFDCDHWLHAGWTKARAWQWQDHSELQFLIIEVPKRGDHFSEGNAPEGDDRLIIGRKDVDDEAPDFVFIDGPLYTDDGHVSSPVSTPVGYRRQIVSILAVIHGQDWMPLWLDGILTEEEQDEVGDDVDAALGLLAGRGIRLITPERYAGESYLFDQDHAVDVDTEPFPIDD